MLLRACGLSLILCAAACMSPEEELGRADREVVEGTPVIDYPTAGSLQRAQGDASPRMICTGTLIGCDTFLTAAHCLCEEVDGNPCAIPTPVEELSVYFQHAGIIPVASVSTHPSFDFPRADIAVVRLAEPVRSIRPTPLAVDNPPLDALLTIVGFGITSKGGVDDGIKREGVLQRAACATQSDELMLCYEPEDSPTVSCNGDSGGPNFIDIGGVEHVAGIVAGGGTTESCVSRQKFATLVSAHLDFVYEHAGELGADRCGELPQIGEAGGRVATASGDEPREIHSIAVPKGTAELRIAANALRGDFVSLAVARDREPDFLLDLCGDRGRMSTYCQIDSPPAGTYQVLIASDTEHQLAMSTVAGAPTAAMDLYEALSGRSLRVKVGEGLLLNDRQGHGRELRTELAEAPQNGEASVAEDGSFVYTAASGYVGNDSFRYRVFEGEYSSEGVVHIQVVEDVIGDCGCQTRSPRQGASVLFVLLALGFIRRRRRVGALKGC